VESEAMEDEDEDEDTVMEASDSDHIPEIKTRSG
jgi:hypothetical protein